MEAWGAGAIARSPGGRGGPDPRGVPTPHPLQPPRGEDSIDEKDAWGLLALVMVLGVRLLSERKDQ